ncbi:MAG: sugar ABC transporter ATP-binding protein [Fimbriimonadaceae bacterium]
MPRLEVRDVTMQFPAVRALDGVSLSFELGEVHGVVGENGAGKSTLMRILSGLQRPTSGQVLVDGSVVELHGVRHALSLGIAMIHQELDVIDDLTVAENVFLGSEPKRFGLVDRKAMNERTAELLRRVGAAFPPQTSVASLSIAGKQLVEIAKALSHEARALIMDEPTAVLSERETESLFRLIGELRAQGVTVIYISHRLAEVEQLCDRVTVLRDGALVCTVDRGALSLAEMADRMVGRTLGDMFPPKGEPQTTGVTLRASGAKVEGWVKDATVEVRAGEVVGIAGLVGSGRTELCEAIVGLRRLSEGTVTLGGDRAMFSSPGQAMRQGVAYVSEDRKGAGLVMEMNCFENASLPSLRTIARPLVDRGAERAMFEKWRTKLDVRVGDPKAPVLYLSGGNQQKIAIAKWLETAPRVLILDEPTRGVDVGAKREIYALVRQLANEGLACIVVSSELTEIVGLCDRVFVMREGRTVGELVGSAVTEEGIMALAAGVGAA